MIYTIKMIF